MDTGQKYVKYTVNGQNYFDALPNTGNVPQGQTEINYNDFITGTRQQGITNLQRYLGQSTSQAPGMGDSNRRAALNAFNEYGGQSTLDKLLSGANDFDAIGRANRLDPKLFQQGLQSGITMVNGIPTQTSSINPATGQVDINKELSAQGASGVGAIPNFNTQTGQATSSNVGSQLGAVSGTSTTNNTTGTSQSDLESQYAALIGKSPEEIAAQKAIDDQNNAMRTGQANLAEQPIGMQFISGQQKSLEDRNTNLQIPLAQRLANEQQKRQASLDAIKFQLERSDKAKELEVEKAKGFTLGEGEKRYDAQGNQVAYGGPKTSSGTTINNILPSTQNLDTKETAEALMSVNQISNVLDNKDFDSAFGAQGILNRAIPGHPAKDLVASITQILDKAAVAARGQLKGQGQVSNFEVQMLKNAQSALSSYQISPQAARQALIDMQGAIQTSTGGTAKVIMTDKNGNSQVLNADSRGITKAIADGLKVKYTK